MINTTDTIEAMKPATFADAINEIVEKRIRWEMGSFAAANAELYSILGDCLDLFNAIKRSPKLPKGLNALLDERGITYNTSTSLELKLVRLVFADSETAARIHNRLFGYARVLRVAANAGQTSETLAQFIVANHGIEEIRRSGQQGVSPAAKQKALIEQASAQLSEPSDTDLVPNFALPDQLQPKDGEQFSLALVRKNADGTGSIVDGTNNVAAVHAVLAILGKALKANAIKAAEVNATQKAEAQKKQNIAALTAVMEEMGTVASAKANFTPQLRVSVPADELIPA